MYSASVVGGKTEESKPQEVLVKRTELPIYSENSSSLSTENSDEGRNEFVLQGVRLFRSEGCKLVRTMQAVSDRSLTFFRTGVAHSTASYVNAVDYLREDRNILQRIGAIGGGVLLGNIIGIRKGIFKRFLYTTAGGVSAAAICYPAEAEEYLKQSSQLSKKYATIGLHFLNGVSKDLTGYELPTFTSKSSSQESQEAVKKD